VFFGGLSPSPKVARKCGEGKDNEDTERHKKTGERESRSGTHGFFRKGGGEEGASELLL